MTANSDLLVLSEIKTAASTSGENSAEELEDHHGTHTPSQETESPSEPHPPLEQGSCHIPIHSLSTEFLLEVIRHDMYTYVDSVPGDYYHRLVGLSGVCSRWWHVIRGSPELWSRIHGSDSADILKLAVKRSSGRPLNVVLEAGTLYGGLGEEGSDHLEWFLDEVRSHVHRWRSVIISFPVVFTDDIIATLDEPAPNLERFSLSAYEHEDLDPLFSGIAIRWDSEVIHDLTALDLCYITFDCTDEILDALSHSPQLRTLVIKDCTTKSMASASCASIQLLQLSVLEVDLGSPDATEDLLDHIEDNRDDAPPQLLSRRKRVGANS